MARLLAVAVALKWALRSAPNCPRRGPATALCRRGKNAKRTRVKTSSWERRGDHRDFVADLTGGLSCRDSPSTRLRKSQAALEAAGVLSAVSASRLGCALALARRPLDGWRLEAGAKGRPIWQREPRKSPTDATSS